MGLPTSASESSPPPPAPPARRGVLYVLAGYDNVDAFKDELVALEKRAREVGDVVILRAQQGERWEDTVKKIPPGSNVLLAAHGAKEGFVQWHDYGQAYDPKTQNIDYAAFLKALPRDTISVGIHGCYGGSAQQGLEAMPPGAILYSMTGNKAMVVNKALARFGEEVAGMRGALDPTRMMLEALDNVDPKLFVMYQENNNKIVAADPQKISTYGPIQHIDPKDVLPHLIGIGGQPPIVIDLNRQMQAMAESGKAGSLDAHGFLQRGPFAQAVGMVKLRFDDNAGPDTPAPGGYYEKNGANLRHAEIDAVADKLRHGEDPATFTIEETRIAYALAVAHLETSGKMKELIEQAKSTSTTAIIPAHVQEAARQACSMTGMPCIDATTVAAAPPTPAPAPSGPGVTGGVKR